MVVKGRPSRWVYLFTAIVVFSCQLWILYICNWNIFVMYTTIIHGWFTVLITWLHLFWGVHNLLKFINYNVNYKEMEDIGKKEEDE